MVAEDYNEHDVLAIIDKYLQEFWPTLRRPRIKIVNRQRADYLALCVWDPRIPTISTIEIQKSALVDLTTLERVLAHELIHHYHYMTTDMEQHLRLKKMGIAPDGHGEDFMAQAARVNAVKGKDFVTKVSDQEYVTSGPTKDIYVIIEPIPSRPGEFGWTTSLRPSAGQKAEIKARIENKQAKVFRSKDADLMTGNAIKKYGGTFIPKNPAVKDKLKDLYHNGTPVEAP